MRAPRTTRRSRTASARATPTTPTGRNTASAIIAAAAAPRRARPRSRVAAGAVARKVLGDGVAIRGALVQMGPHAIDRARWDWAAVDDNPFWSPDRQAAQTWEGYLDDLRKHGSSTGAVIEVVAERRARGPRRADLRQARRRPRQGDDEHQRREGGRDRRRLRRGVAHRRGECRRDAHARGQRVDLPLQPRRRHPRRHLDRPGHRAALRRQADELDPDAAPDASISTATTSRSPPRAATTPASASAPCRSAKR